MEDLYAAFYRTVSDRDPFIEYRIYTNIKTVFCHASGSISTRSGHRVWFNVSFQTTEILLKGARVDHTRHTAYDPAVDHLLFSGTCTAYPDMGGQ